MSASNSETKLWKERYEKLAAELDNSSSFGQQNIATCRRVLTRLSRAAKGFDARLDPHLIYLRKELKEHDSNHDFLQIIETFSDKLLHYEDDSDEDLLQDAGLLFDFLISQEKNENKVRAFILLREQYEMKELDDAQELIKLLTVLSLRDDDKEEDKSALHGANLEISEQLIELLQGDEISDISHEQAQIVINMLKDGASGNFYENVSAALVLLQSIKKQDCLEKQSMDSFLDNIAQKLVGLAKNAEDVVAHTGGTFNKYDNLDTDVAESMAGLQKKVSIATNLEPLKSVMQIELEKIGKKIKLHKQEIKLDQSESDKQLALMTSEIEVMRTKTIELTANLERVTRQSLTDTLTKLPNRLAYSQRLDEEFSRWKRYHTPLCLLVWDIDFFKKINDGYGHKAGDKVLIMMGKILQKYCRETDFVARFGGEEFVMLLPNTQSSAALVLANKVRQRIEGIGFNYSGKSLKITISCGIAEAKAGNNQESLFERADKGLYAAKGNGRNQCIIA